MEVLLIRHAESKWQTEEDKSRDSDISSKGIRQAYQLANHLGDSLDSHTFISSGLKRAKQTSSIISRSSKEDHRLNEAHFHVASKLPEYDTCSIECTRTSESREYQLFKEKLICFMSELVNSDMQRVALITHGGVIKTIMRIIHDNDSIDYIVNNASITKLIWYRNRWTIEYINLSHYIEKGMRT